MREWWRGLRDISGLSGNVSDDGATPRVSRPEKGEFESLAAQIDIEVVCLGLDSVGEVG